MKSEKLKEIASLQTMSFVIFGKCKHCLYEEIFKRPPSGEHKANVNSWADREDAWQKNKNKIVVRVIPEQSVCMINDGTGHLMDIIRYPLGEKIGFNKWVPALSREVYSRACGYFHGTEREYLNIKAYIYAKSIVPDKEFMLRIREQEYLYLFSKTLFTPDPKDEPSILFPKIRREFPGTYFFYRDLMFPVRDTNENPDAYMTYKILDCMIRNMDVPSDFWIPSRDTREFKIFHMMDNIISNNRYRLPDEMVKIYKDCLEDEQELQEKELVRKVTDFMFDAIWENNNDD